MLQVKWGVREPFRRASWRVIAGRVARLSMRAGSRHLPMKAPQKPIANHQYLGDGNAKKLQRVVRLKSMLPQAIQLEFSQMPKENDLEGRQDMGGKHGGQAVMPKPEDRSSAQQGIVRDEKRQERPADKERAQHVSRKDRGNDPPGDPKQR